MMQEVAFFYKVMSVYIPVKHDVKACNIILYVSKITDEFHV